MCRYLFRYVFANYFVFSLYWGLRFEFDFFLFLVGLNIALNICGHIVTMPACRRVVWPFIDYEWLYRHRAYQLLCYPLMRNTILQAIVTHYHVLVWADREIITTHRANARLQCYIGGLLVSLIGYFSQINIRGQIIYGSDFSDGAEIDDAFGLNNLNYFFKMSRVAMLIPVVVLSINVEHHTGSHGHPL